MTRGEERERANNPVTQEIRQQRLDAIAQQQAQAAENKADIAVLAATDAGKRFLRRLFLLTCADLPTVVINANTGEVIQSRTLMNEGKRELWMVLRKDFSNDLYIEMFTHGLKEKD